MNVYLCDDDQDDKYILQEVLKVIYPDAELTSFYSGKSLLAHLSDGSNEIPDIIFLDIIMPCENGLDILTQLKSNRYTSTIPVIIFTCVSDPKYIFNSFKSGAYRYLLKPSSYTELCEMVTDIFAQPFAQPKSIEQYLIPGQIAVNVIRKKDF